MDPRPTPCAVPDKPPPPPQKCSKKVSPPGGLIEDLRCPTKARVVVGGGTFPINSVQCLVKKSSELDHKVSVPRASRGKRSVEMRAQKQIVTVNEK